MKYNYYNSGNDSIKAINTIYPGIETPDDLYEALQYCWTEETCTERLRKRFSDKNKTAGQCAITSFLVQDIFGGEIYGTETGRGKHWYNVVNGFAFDLTSEQFGEEAKNLVYDKKILLSSRESIWNATGKKERYFLLKQNLEHLLPKTISVNGREFMIEKLIGHGKGGYSYLVHAFADSAGSRDVCHAEKYVLKQIHHEPCDYYTFGNKIEAELDSYDKLCRIGITMPKMIDFDRDNERILKEYIDGTTIDKLVQDDRMQDDYVNQMQKMCTLLYAANTNIDYYPTNFVIQKEKLYYIDYECNDYMEKWDFEHWGCQFWGSNAQKLFVHN